MREFKENRCRLCAKVFCCKDCRLKHEEAAHGVETECDICIYGKIIINDTPTSVLNHIRNKHWPLHCVLCNIIFNSLDDLVIHQKCTMASNIKIPGTPVTPVAENQAEPSPVTPYVKMPGHHLIGLTITMGVTSTPMQRNDQSDKIKITPSDQSEIKYIYKSSLKLTASGSSNLTDSKKSERRVTFSETPMTEVSRKPKIFPKIAKYFPQISQISTIKPEADHNDSSASIDELFTSAHDISGNVDDENKENLALTPFKSNNHCDTESALWETALTGDLDVSSTKMVLYIENTKKFGPQLSKSENFGSLRDDDLCDEVNQSSLNQSEAYTSAEMSAKNKSLGIWSSMTNIVKSVMHNISFTSQSDTSTSMKRSQPDCDDSLEDAPCYKKMKLTEIKCRRPIRDIAPWYPIRLSKPNYVDKATQTEDDLFW